MTPVKELLVGGRGFLLGRQTQEASKDSSIVRISHVVDDAVGAEIQRQILLPMNEMQYLHKVDVGGEGCEETDDHESCRRRFVYSEWRQKGYRCVGHHTRSKAGNIGSCQAKQDRFYREPQNVDEEY